jgi:hypothetical protein
MGSHGVGWHRCAQCRRWGMNAGHIPEGVAILTDVDGIGLQCDPCYVRGGPPHYDYLHKLLRANFALAGEEYVLHTIAMYAYPEYEAAVRDV